VEATISSGTAPVRLTNDPPTANRQSARQARQEAGQLVVAYPENDYVQSALRALLSG
jgi:hypothetical protein